MNHKCVRCGTLYEQGSQEIVNGCLCGGKLFYFVKDKKSKKKDEQVDYFYELDDDAHHEIMVFDVETIHVHDGKYEIDIDGIMQNNTLIYEYDEGKYSIDLRPDVRSRKKR